MPYHTFAIQNAAMVYMYRPAIMLKHMYMQMVLWLKEVAGGAGQGGSQSADSTTGIHFCRHTE